MAYSVAHGFGEDVAPPWWTIAYVDGVPTFVNKNGIVSELDARRLDVEEPSIGPQLPNGVAWTKAAGDPYTPPWVDGLVSQGWGVIATTQWNAGGEWALGIPVVWSNDAVALAPLLQKSAMQWAWVGGPPALFAQLVQAMKTLTPLPQLCKVPGDPSFKEGDLVCPSPGPPAEIPGADISATVEHDGLRTFVNRDAVLALLDAGVYQEQDAEQGVSMGIVTFPSTPSQPWIKNVSAEHGVAVVARYEDLAAPQNGVRVAMTNEAATLVGLAATGWEPPTVWALLGAPKALLEETVGIISTIPKVPPVPPPEPPPGPTPPVAPPPPTSSTMASVLVPALGVAVLLGVAAAVAKSRKRG